MPCPAGAVRMVNAELLRSTQDHVRKSQSSIFSLSLLSLSSPFLPVRHLKVQESFLLFPGSRGTNAPGVIRGYYYNTKTVLIIQLWSEHAQEKIGWRDYPY